MTEWSHEINEIPVIDHPDKPVIVRFKMLRDGEWQKDMNNQIEIPQKDLLGLTPIQKAELIRDRIQAKMDAILSPPVQEFKDIQNLVGWKFGLKEKGEVPDFSKVKEIKEDEI